MIDSSPFIHCDCWSSPVKMYMPTGEHCWKKNSGAQWTRANNLWIPSLTRSVLNYVGRYVEWDLFKDTTESNTSASYLDLLLSIESDGQLRTSLYDKRDHFNNHITNFPFLSSNIPSSLAYGVFISQLIRYARACSSYECIIVRAARLSSKLLRQVYVMERLKSSLRKFYGRYGGLIKHCEVSLSQMLHDILGHDYVQWHPLLIRHYTNLRTYCRTGLDYRFWPYYQIFEVSIEDCNGCG